MKRIHVSLLSLWLLVTFAQTTVVPRAHAQTLPSTVYLFSYFRNNGEDGLHLAWSRDGLKWEALNGSKSLLKPTVGRSKLMRDPCVVQGPDGTFHMVWTDSWDSQTIGSASTKDFIQWSPQKAIPVMTHEPSAKNCWAPEIAYDAKRGVFMIFWATTLPEQFKETWFDGKNDNNHRIYVITTKDFQSFSPTKLFFDPGFNVIDSTLLVRDEQIYMISKDETKFPQAMKNLRLATATDLAGPYKLDPAPINAPGAWVEGPTALTIGEYTYLYYDVYTKHRYGVLRTRDMKTWENVSAQLSMPQGIRHGTAFAVPSDVVKGLLASSGGSAKPAGAANSVTVTVDTAAAGIAVSPTMHGVFFEDINYGADGGLYAELLPNRSFENREALFAWTILNAGGDGQVTITNAQPLNPNNPNYARLTIRDAGHGFGLANSGYEGIAVQRGASYLFTTRARGGGGYRGDVLVRLEDAAGQSLGECKLTAPGTEWMKLEGKLVATTTTTNARLVVLAMGTGSLDLDVVSLFPENTWRQRRNGLRADLVQMLADLKPGFMRFPGGCIVEGKDLANAYRWKETIGDISERKQNWNRWQDAVSTKAPQYYQTYGLGFFEYFQLCEDIGAEPVPIINCGMSCQYQDKQLVPLAELDPWVQDALDLVEFANGPVTSTWGAKRAAMGHPEPFHLKLLGVGNEQWDEQYFERYLIFYRALKARYPDLTLITTSGPGVDDQWWNLAWNKFKQGTPAEIVDEHYYRPPQWFLQQATRYDAYDRKGPKVFAGEFAAHDRNRRSNLRCAINEAAFMTGLLRNADVVHLASYAPLFARAGFTQWEPDLIWFDSTRAYGTPSYHVQKLFSRNRPDTVLPTKVGAAGAAPVFKGRVGVGTWNTQAEFKDIKITRGDQTLYASDFAKGTTDWAMERGQWQIVDGALRQAAAGENCLALVGNPDWSNYTLSLKARKISGAEGFLILFQTENGSEPTWWNLGGWRNTQHGLSLAGNDGERVRGNIESDRWYDVRVELNSDLIQCYLDGRLVQEARRGTRDNVYTVAGRDARTGELIIDAVNVNDHAAELVLDLGAFKAASGQASVLTSGSLEDENSFTNPAKVAPRHELVTCDGNPVKYLLPPHALAVLRLKPAGDQASR
jgi:alpha-L-arabinofuranosidase